MQNFNDHVPAEPLQNQPLSFFTICAQNYLAFAIVLGNSLQNSVTGAKLTVFVLDGVPDDKSGMEHLDLRPANLVLEPNDWSHRQAYYDILEFSTSIKPACFLQMMRNQHKFIVYLDPDILVLKPFDELVLAFTQGQEIVITPHTVKPFPKKQKRPDDLEILRAGIYNLGFAAFRNSPRSKEILTWWDDKLRTLCFSDKQEGVFTDQKWIDYIPAFESRVQILRHPGYNAAYWNLHERSIIYRNGEWNVQQNGEALLPLIFFHFSGFSPNQSTLSKYDDRSEHDLSEDLKILLAVYAQKLNESRFNELYGRSLPDVRFVTGEAWDPICRALYKESVKAEIELGNPLQDNQFISWIVSKETGDHLPRYLRMLLKLRPDLANAFNDGRDLYGLLNWLTRHGVKQLGIEKDLLVKLGLAELGGPLKGINYVGYLRSHMGVAQAARGYLEAVATTGMPTNIYDVSNAAVISPTAIYPHGNYKLLKKFSSNPPIPYNFTVFHVNADQLPATLVKLPADLQKTFKIAIWAWESMEFPDAWCDRFDLVDEIWVASKFMADAVREKSTVPVFVVPHVVNPPRVEPDRAWLSTLVPEIQDNEFLFLFQFDAHSVPHRKNPEGTIKAFMNAFTPDEPVRLIIKTLNADSADNLIHNLRKLASGSRISILNTALGDTQRYRMLATVDSFVSLHRAEGFGLSIAEAMAYAKPVIATNWSGNIDFMDNASAVLVRYRLKPLAQQHGPYVAGTLWAEPDLSDAALQMRKVYESPTWRQQLGEAAALRVAALLGTQVIGRIIQSRIDRIAASERFQEKYARTIKMAMSKSQASSSRSLSIYLIQNAFTRPVYFLHRSRKAFQYLRSYGWRAAIERTWLHMK